MFGDVKISRLGDEMEVVMFSTRREKRIPRRTPLFILCDDEKKVVSTLADWAARMNDPEIQEHPISLLLEASAAAACEIVASPVLRRVPEVRELNLAI